MRFSANIYNYPALPDPWRHIMARITVEDCQQRVDNRFLLVQMAIKRVRQFREGYEPLVDSKNKEVVTALREIAAGKVLPVDKRFYTPAPGEEA